MAQLGSCGRQQQDCCVNDAVCFNIEIETGGEEQLVWTNNGAFTINGTIVIENDGIEEGPSASLVVNGVATGVVVAPGESEAVTLDNLNSISVAPEGGGEGLTSDVKVAFSINYRF
ncbi:DUF3992 domain-containing protein [Alteribacter aurantiacus]|uniref:DUF3992 domain-containing protein n=1 Tax=Alteribacter aurantiacus TaxID=254410 RepID=UPI000400BF67|nr:S-Ena type endospore appendage [Alteribacter aurantiacus]